MDQFIKNLDIFGQSIQLTFRKESKFKTQMGGIISLIFFLVLGYLIALKTAEFSDIDNAHTYTRTVTNTDDSPQDLFGLDFRIAITKLDPRFGEIEAV